MKTDRTILMALLIPLLLELLVAFTAVPSPRQPAPTCIEQTELVGSALSLCSLDDHRKNNSELFRSGVLPSRPAAAHADFGHTADSFPGRPFPRRPLACGWALPLRI